MNVQEYIFTIYVIKGEENFRKWERNLLECKEIIDLRVICPSIADDNMKYEYTATSEDIYFLNFYLGCQESNITIQLVFNVSQVLYAVTPDIIEDSCSFTPVNAKEHCRLRIRYYNTYQKALLKLPLIINLLPLLLNL